MSYNADIAVYKTQIDNDISTQSLPNSIPPDVVGSGYTDLADLLAPYINAINNEAILSGSGVPSSGTGNDLDLYYRTQSSFFELYRKESGAWVLKVSVPFGITLPDGPATLRTFISGTTASVTKGGWFISNAVYNKLTQTNFTVPAADATFYRTDLIYADTSNQILYLSGTPSLTPVDPTLPANTIAVDYVIVPSVASGFDPYLRFGSTTESNGIAEQNDTGALTYGGISVASTTTVNIGACTGYVVNNESVPGSPTITFVNYAGETGKTVTTLGSGIATYVLLNSSGTIVFQNSFPTSPQRKTHIYLSKIGHPTGTINTAGDEVDFVLSPLAQHRDLFQALNYINNGVQATASGATLNFMLSTGVITGDGINFVADNTNPNNYTVPPQPTASFLPRTQTGAGGGFTTTVDVGNYDVAGTITAIPGGANNSTLKYIFYVPPLGLIVQYGQTVYSSLTDAISAVGKEAFTVYPSLVRNAILIGVLAATKSATALNNTLQARFFLADKFGQITGAQAGVSISTLQGTYDNSLQPQITTTTALGAVQFKRGSAADTDNVFQVLNGAGTAGFGISGNGKATIGSHPLSGVPTPTNFQSSVSYNTSGDNLNGLFFTEQTIANANSVQGLEGYTKSSNATGIVATLFGLIGNAEHSGAGTVTSVRSLQGGGILSGSGTVTEWKGLNVQGGFITGTGTVTNSYGVYVNAPVSGSGTITNRIGMQIEDVGTGSNSYAIRTMGGKVRIDGTQEITGGAEALKVQTNTGNPDHAYIGLYARTATPTTQSGQFGYISAGTNTLSLTNSITGGNISVSTTGTGNVLVNAPQFIAQLSTDNYRLLVSKTGAVNESSLTNSASGVTFGGAVYRGTVAAKTLPLSADKLTRFAGGAYIDSGNTYYGTTMSSVATENWINGTNYGSKLEFYTTPNATVAQALALTIDQDGSLVHAGSRSGTATKWIGVDSTGKVVDAASVYNYSATYDVPSLAAGAVDAHTVSVPGCLLGDFVIASMDTPLGHYLTLKAYVSTNGSVDVVFHNTSTGTIDLVSATLRLKVIRS